MPMRKTITSIGDEQANVFYNFWKFLKKGQNEAVTQNGGQIQHL